MSGIDRESEPDAMKALRGPLSKRATSAEFNEWNSRDVVDYVDSILTALAAAEAREAKLREALEPFALAWDIATDVLPKTASLSYFGVIAEHHVSAASYKRARAALTDKGDTDNGR